MCSEDLESESDVTVWLNWSKVFSGDFVPIELLLDLPAAFWAYITDMSHFRARYITIGLFCASYITPKGLFWASYITIRGTPYITNICYSYITIMGHFWTTYITVTFRCSYITIIKRNLLDHNRVARDNWYITKDALTVIRQVSKRGDGGGRGRGRGGRHLIGKRPDRDLR